MFRLYFLVFAGEYRGGPEHHDEHGHGEHGHGDPHESPDAMTIPLVVLGIGAFCSGFLWIGALALVDVHFEPWVEWLAPALASGAEHEIPKMVTITAVVSGIAAATVGIFLAWSWYARPGVETPRRLAEQFAGLHRLVFDKWRVDELYDATILRASRALGVVSAGIDKVVVDGLLTSVTSAAVQAGGFLFTRIQNGLVQAYAAVMVGGLLVVTWWFTVPHVRIEVPKPPSGDAVELSAGAGLGYQYRWDFDSDGHFDTEWSADSSASHSYVSEELQPGVIVVLESALYGQALSHKHLEIGDKVQLETADLGGNWQSGDDDTPPVIEATDRGILIHKNGARVRIGGKSVADDALAIVRGEHADIGQARVTVAGLARPTLRVRNAFGVERQNSSRVLLPEVTQRPAVEVVGMAEAHP
jgi:hypothetical protein